MTAMVLAGSPRVFAVGHFPPPVHGMSVATARLTELAEDRAKVVRLDISGNSHGRSTRHHLVRIIRTCKAVAAMARRGRRGDSVYLACDAGPGMLYTIALLLTARLRGFNCYAHHHSYAYLSRRSRLMGAVVRTGGVATTHIVTCPAQAALLRDHYPLARRTLVLPITYVLDRAVPPTAARPMANRRIVLGHLSNLTAEKGLFRAAATLVKLLDQDMDAELVLAGPSPTPKDASDLAAVLRESNGRVTHLGAVQDADKERFFQRIDVFLFPTRYRNESFGIVAAEAMAHGVPVIAYRAGCLDAAWVGGGGLVLDPDSHFSSSAATQIQSWVDDHEAFSVATKEAFERANAARLEGSRATSALVDRLAGLGPVSGGLAIA